MSDVLDWLPETAAAQVTPCWSHAGSNLCLDFHGDPLTAQRVNA